MKLTVFILSLILFQPAFAAPEAKEEIEKAVKANMSYLEQEDPDGPMSTIHTQSLSYKPTKNALAQLFGAYKLSYKLISYEFIVVDRGLAYVRVKQRTKKISGPAFNNNEVDMVQIFKQEDGVWKLWSQANLTISYIN